MYLHTGPSEAQVEKHHLSLLGKPGSNPIDLFWVIVDVPDQGLDKKVNVFEDTIERHNNAHAPT